MKRILQLVTILALVLTTVNFIPVAAHDNNNNNHNCNVNNYSNEIINRAWKQAF